MKFLKREEGLVGCIALPAGATESPTESRDSVAQWVVMYNQQNIYPNGLNHLCHPYRSIHLKVNDGEKMCSF